MTKNEPGKYDCYANAEPDEPLFVLLARDPLAEFLVAAWVALKAGDLVSAVHLMGQASEAHAFSGKEVLDYRHEKLIEAQQCARAIRDWRQTKQATKITERLARQPE